ncbi:PH domain-containing protein [Virgibacillus sp. NKC19-16]|uniref:PH domain-containing protein n=1 Tax=Virgibacillus salidurans TaxID=2831673 RepID=UPI001F345F61|nr:PH domain-containing protein [Virgibacillus sp. NKC19-16]UJL46225.1 PH domain-containing protein [Virgibacillus sp. NKC19-16]
MYTHVQAPEDRLSKDSVKVWLISETTMNIIGFIILGVLFYLDYHFFWNEWIGWVLIGMTVISVFTTIWSFFNAFLLYKHWRYGVSAEFLQLKSGALNEKHQLIPMTKIQFVSTKQGPIMRKYRLYSITVKTIGSEHVIPALHETVAMELRDQIAHYAKVKEADE